MTINERLNEIQSHLNSIEMRFNNIDIRLNNLDSRLNNMENHPLAINTQLREQLDRIERGGRRNFFWGGGAFSFAVMIYALSLLTANHLSIEGIILGISGIVLGLLCGVNILRNR